MLFFLYEDDGVKPFYCDGYFKLFVMEGSQAGNRKTKRKIS